MALLGTQLTPNCIRAEELAESSLATREQAAVRAAVDRVADSVVQIRTIGGFEEADETLLASGPTTGLILSDDGWIISSSFNFVHQPTSILVILPNGEQLPAELIARDHSRLLALLKVDAADDLPIPELAPADEVRVGQWAIAVGRTFRADRPNVSVGIVSALDRMFGKVLQTDADVSTANYGGPLVDIRGRVLGVIVPIAPQTTSEVAGAEWYDSGIGFAVPLAEISDSIERMKRGEDQRAGLLGISLAGNRPHDTAAKVAAVLPNGPAGKAGLKKGDEIVAIDERPIHTQTDLRFALGPRYAGEEIRVTARRGDVESTYSLELAGELAPFHHAFLGILPLRDPPEVPDDEDDPREEKKPAGVRIRLVFPGSPAELAGIQPGDRLLEIDGAKIGSIDAALVAMNSTWPQADLSVAIERGDERRELVLQATELPAFTPADLPAAYDAPATPRADADSSKPDVRELKLAEFAQKCRIYVPPSHEAGRPAGVLIWLHAPGQPPDDALFDQWQKTCDRDGLLLVAPEAEDAGRWERTELEYLRRLTERVLREYKVDTHRVVVGGRAGGGAMAYLLALSSRDLFTGVATWSAPVPRTVRVPTNQPTARLAVFAGLPTDRQRLAQIRVGIKKLTDAGYAVSMLSQDDPSGRLTDEDRRQLARWIDTLDRF
jgi:serine protease Do